MFSVTLTPLGTSRQGNRAASVPCLPSVTERHTSEAPLASGGEEQTARSLSARLWPEQGRPRRLTAAAQSAVVGAAAAALCPAVKLRGPHPGWSWWGARWRRGRPADRRAVPARSAQAPDFSTSSSALLVFSLG